jgi:hypothetical protein
MQSLEPPEPSSLERSKELITRAAQLLPSRLKATYYDSLLGYHTFDSHANPKSLITELNDLVINTLLYNAEDEGGIKGQPPTIPKKLAKIRPYYEKWGARVET